MMYAVPLSASQQLQQQQQSEPSSSSSEWGAAPGSAHSPSSSSSGGPWGSATTPTTTTMTDITNKPSSGGTSNNGASAGQATDWSISPTSAATSVWQTGGGGSSNEPGDSNKNSWNSQAAKNSALLASNSPGGQQGQDKENQQLPTTPVSADRSPLDHMIYRQGWGQIEVKQEVPWAVPESPPPVHEDPSMWKPKANTGTEVWEKSTGHRTQPWQNQAPNTPRWISGDERDEGSSSVWNGAPGSGGSGSSQSMSGPGASGILSSNGGGMMSMNGGSSGNGGNSILSSNGPVSQAGRPSWNSSGPGSGGSGASSGGNISPTNNNNSSSQWNDNVQDQEWSEWRDPSSITKRENVNGTDLWGSGGVGVSGGGGGVSGGGVGVGGGGVSQPPLQNRSTSNLYGNSNNLPSLNSDPRKSQSDEQRPRGWQDAVPGGYAPSSVSSQQMQQQQQRSSDWSADNEWRGSDNEKSSRSQWGTSGRDHPPQRPPSPPSNVGRYSREQIYQSKQYQGLLEMGFKREDIDTAMRNNNMNYEATLSDLKRRRIQQQQMHMQLQQQQQASLGNNSGFGVGMGGGPLDASYKTGFPGTGPTGGGGGGGAAGNLMNVNGPGGLGLQQQQQQAHQNTQMQLQQQAGKNYRPVPNIHALAHQLSVAAKQGIINPRLLNQPLAPQTTFLLHKLMGQHRSLQQLNAQQEMLSIASQKPTNPSLQQQQQQQLSQLAAAIQQTKKEIIQFQKQIDVIQNEYAKSPMDPRFQGGDLANASMSPPGFADFHSPQVPAPTGSYNPGWRMPDPSPYTSPLVSGGGGADSWGGNMGGGSNNFMMANAFPAQAPPMWSDPSQWGMHGGGGAAHGGMNNYRGMAPLAGGAGAHSSMEDWTSHMSMKSPGGPGMSANEALSPSRGGVSGNGSAGFGMDDTDGGHWGGNRQPNSATFANNNPNANNNANSTFSTFAWETLPEFEPGKPWRGSQLLNADEDPHLTPGSVQNKNPLMNAVASSGSGGGGGHYNPADSQ